MYISLSVAEAKQVFTRSMASASDSGVTASCKFIAIFIRHEIKDCLSIFPFRQLEDKPLQVIAGGLETLAGCPEKA